MRIILRRRSLISVVCSVHALPLRRLRMRHAQVIENAENEMVHQGFDRLWPVIKTGTGGNDVRARA